jgi:hypothetical protein
MCCSDKFVQHRRERRFKSVLFETVFAARLVSSHLHAKNDGPNLRESHAE